MDCVGMESREVRRGRAGRRGEAENGRMGRGGGEKGRRGEGEREVDIIQDQCGSLERSNTGE